MGQARHRCAIVAIQYIPRRSQNKIYLPSCLSTEMRLTISLSNKAVVFTGCPPKLVIDFMSSNADHYPVSAVFELADRQAYINLRLDPLVRPPTSNILMIPRWAGAALYGGYPNGLLLCDVTYHMFAGNAHTLTLLILFFNCRFVFLSLSSSKKMEPLYHGPRGVSDHVLSPTLA